MDIAARTRHHKKILCNFRIAIVALLFTFTFCLLQVSGSVTETPIKRSLDQFPQRIGKWTRLNTHSLSNQVSEMLGVDDYISYDYASPDGLVLNLYVSYFNSLGQMKGYHSPRNCLPASGWDVADIKPLKLDIRHSGLKTSQANMVTITKSGEKRLVIYWYHGRGRIFSSEYWGKIYLVLDSIFKRRTDSTFVQIMAPLPNTQIKEVGYYPEEFAKQVMLILQEFIPGN
jgi:EpsI family protein